MYVRAKKFRRMTVFAERTELIKLSLYTSLQLFSVPSDGDPAA